MSKHTPGLWKIAPNGYDIVPSGIREDATAVIARVFGSYNPASNGGVLDVRDLPQEANARLIAAAPEMLGALKRLIAYRDDGSETCNFARIVIAKAEGRES